MKLTRLQIDGFIIVTVSLFLFTYGLFDRELIQFETRFGVFVQEMLIRGPSFFPTTYFSPYPDYPGLQTFLIYLLCLPFGKLNTLLAILPSAIASSLSLLLTYLIVAKIDRTWAWATVLITGLTYEFLVAARSLTMDPFVMLATVWAFYAIREQHWSYWFALILGFAIRGPIGFIIPAAIIGVTLWSNENLKKALVFSAKAAILLATLIIILLLLAHIEGGASFVADVLSMQIFGRLNDTTQSSHFFYYFIESFSNYGLSFELALITLILFYKKTRTSTSADVKLLRTCFYGILIIILGMSIPSVRKIRYLMPIVPVLAILASYAWYAFHEDIKKKTSIIALNYFFIGLPFFCFICINILEIFALRTAFIIHAHVFSAIFLLGLLCLIACWIFYRGMPAFGMKHPIALLSIGFVTWWTMLVFIVSPIEVSLNQAGPFVRSVLKSLPAGKNLVFFQMKPDGMAIQFLLHAHFKKAPQFINSLSTPFPKDAWLITSLDNFQHQDAAFKRQVNVIKQGKLGHHKMVIFYVPSETHEAKYD